MVKGRRIKRVERHLAAILAADVAGYSRMMGEDEIGTLSALKKLRRDVLDPKVRANRGRIAKTTGDGVLAEFASVVDAVGCAVEIQRLLSKHGAATPGIRLRMGINLGDIIKDGTDIYGDGVNIAARLEALAEPGGILVSNTVHDHVRGKLPLEFEDQGERDLKNIARPIRVYRVRVAAERPAATASAAPRLALPMPDKPSIAVLPFANLSGDPEQDFVADGLTEDIITGLARLSWLFVIARNSTFVYKGKSIDVRRVARELGVRYVLEGSVRVAGKQIRITGQLIEAETGKHIWAQKYDHVLEDLFAVQDDITERVVAAVEPHLYAEEGFRAASQHPDNVDAWGRVVRAMGMVSKLERLQNEEAQRLLGSVIAISPRYARAHALLGWAKWWAVLCYWTADARAGQSEAAAHAQDALAFDPADPWGRMVAGLCLSSSGQHDRALAELRAALDLNPSFALGHMAYGWGLLRAGRFDQAIAETRQALRLSPLDSFSGFYTTIHGLALLGARRFEEALPFLRSSILAFAEYAGHYNTLISCCGHVGLLAEANEYIAVRNKIGPSLRLSVLRQNLAHFAHRDVFIEGLKKAGVPE
jgi:adenylate cyclase